MEPRPQIGLRVAAAGLGLFDVYLVRVAVQSKGGCLRERTSRKSVEAAASSPHILGLLQRCAIVSRFTAPVIGEKSITLIDQLSGWRGRGSRVRCRHPDIAVSTQERPHQSCYRHDKNPEPKSEPASLYPIHSMSMTQRFSSINRSDCRTSIGNFCSGFGKAGEPFELGGSSA
jgi:hypothetical protein